MEDDKVRRVAKDLECFKKLEERLSKVKLYCSENSNRIGGLRDRFKKVREHMGEVNKQQNVAIHHVVAGRKK
eukprot:CAMPEP_0204900356 /NCGR_PEP_ID=MMETSP1397-20131031/2418_1 /ASSEMBLY_ACC=CAM_ASM_000891 /TAXON_ID=49980 /ORGANISM="Climacostomum Climacostomum virens, Strain Stock W-24" /LENGTH=71 /DNA_ID=CAMNT_0052068479 /DNA_START=110 /DNA_END=328 /DNA_ORIENTATION=+